MFSKNKSLQIKVYLVLLAAYLATLFCYAVILSAQNVDTIRFWLAILHVTGPIAITMVLFLMVAFYYDDKIPPLWMSLFILLSVIPLLIRDLFGFTNTVGIIPNRIGNVTVYEKSFFFYYYYIQVFIISLFVMVFIFVKYRTTRLRRLKKLSLFLLLAVGLTWATSVPFHFILPYILKGYGVLVPGTGYLYYSILILASFYALLRYNFMKVDIPFTIDSIMRTISDSILITETGGTVVRANDAACVMFGSFKDRLENMHIRDLFPEWGNPDSRAGAVFSIRDNYSEFRKLPHPRNHSRILDVFFESIHDGFGDFIGLLVICRTNNRLEEARNAFSLTRREIEIITFLHEGLEYQEIAERLHLSMNTVRNHIQNIYAKTGAKNRAILLKTVF